FLGSLRHPRHNSAKPMNITILGAGAWGTALALSLADRHAVFLWGRNHAAMRDAAARRENAAYFPGFALPDGLTVSADFDAALAHARCGVGPDESLLIVATPVAGLRPLALRLQSRKIRNLVWLCKG